MACLLKNGESVISTAEVVPQQHSIMGLWISTFLLPLQPRGSISFLQLMVFMYIYSPLLLVWSFLHIVSNFLFKFLCLGYLGKFLLSRQTQLNHCFRNNFLPNICSVKKQVCPFFLMQQAHKMLNNYKRSPLPELFHALFPSFHCLSYWHYFALIYYISNTF